MNAQPDNATLLGRDLAASNSEQRQSRWVEILEQEDFEETLRWLPELASIQVRFASFTDGRGFSWAQQLRRRYGFAGHLRAVGDLLTDQQQMLEECGFEVDAPESAQVPRFTVAYPH